MVNRRSILLGSAATLLAEKARTSLFGRGGSPPAASGQITSLTLLNTSAGQQPAGTPTPTFGWVFRDGDIAPGTAPTFTLNGAVQPFSAGLQTYWPSGCLKYAAFALLPTSAVAGSVSQTVVISKGGTWPGASSRTLSELYDQNVIVNAPLYDSANNGRGGSTATVSSWLDGDSNQVLAVKWLDGAAGTAWRITTHMAQTKGGTRDGMLTCDHYVFALSNVSGGLGGYRWLGAMRQPLYNQSGQANNSPGPYLFFAAPSTSSPTSGVNWSVQPGGSGPVTTTSLTWLGSDGNNFQNASFSCAGGGTQTCVVTSNGGSDNYYMGGGSDNLLPVIFSGIATSQGSNQGSNVVTGGFGFLYTDYGSPASQFELFFNGQNGGANEYTFSGSSFAGTVNPAPCLAPFQRLFFATRDATYNFFQGTGSIATESTLHVQINQAYWQGSGVIPPYNLSVNGTAMGGTLNEYVYSQDWYPYNIGQMTVYEPGTGDHSDIGILPLYASNDFYNQTVNTLRHNRIIGLSCAFSVTDFVDASTNLRVNFGNPSGAYGLAALSDSGLRYDPSHYASGSNFSVPNTTGLGYGLSLGEHEPAWPVWAYLRTGELQYLDLIVDQLQMAEAYSGSLRTLNSGSAGFSSTEYGVVYFAAGGGEMRFLAWGIRDAQWAAHLYPRDPSGTSGNPVFTDGTNLAQYLTDVADANASWPLLQFQTPAPTIPWTTWSQANGHWYPWYAYPVAVFGGVNSPAFGINGASWEYADLAQVMCLAVARGSANAKTFLEDCIAVQWAHDLAVLGGWLYISDDNRAGYLVADGTGNYAQTLITSDSEYGMPPFSLFANVSASHNHVTWAPNGSSPAFFMNTGFNTLNYGWTPANGDMYIPQPYAFGNANDLWPSAMTAYATYYAVNVTASDSNWEFDLATAPGGSKIAISDTSGAGVSLGFRLQQVNKPPLHDCYTEVYECNFWFACCWALALGITQFGSVTNASTVVGDVQNRMAGSGTNPSGGVSVSPQGVFSNGPGTVDTRYCMRPSFAR
jgi:hypothetical protein